MGLFDKKNKNKSQNVSKPVQNVEPAKVKSPVQNKAPEKKSGKVSVTLLIDSYECKEGKFRKGWAFNLSSGKKLDTLVAGGVVEINK